jgi:rubrerythrin
VGRAKAEEVKPAKLARTIPEIKPEELLARPSRIEGKLLKCPNCGYEWRTRSKLGWVTCPSCLRKVRIKEKR